MHFMHCSLMVSCISVDGNYVIRYHSFEFETNLLVCKLDGNKSCLLLHI
jgi:hypothetical protein